jgi:trehalose 6-phosphate synthase/phosphatase
MLLGVDRLEMIRGVPQRLLAYEMFIEWGENVVLVQILVKNRM